MCVVSEPVCELGVIVSSNFVLCNFEVLVASTCSVDSAIFNEMEPVRSSEYSVGDVYVVWWGSEVVMSFDDESGVSRVCSDSLSAATMSGVVGVPAVYCDDDVCVCRCDVVCRHCTGLERAVVTDIIGVGDVPSGGSVVVSAPGEGCFSCEVAAYVGWAVVSLIEACGIVLVTLMCEVAVVCPGGGRLFGNSPKSVCLACLRGCKLGIRLDLFLLD